jgi:hypothetical protein
MRVERAKPLIKLNILRCLKCKLIIYIYILNARDSPLHSLKQLLCVVWVSNHREFYTSNLPQNAEETLGFKISWGNMSMESIEFVWPAPSPSTYCMQITVFTIYNI